MEHGRKRTCARDGSHGAALGNRQSLRRAWAAVMAQKKNELAQNICASSIQCSIRVAGYGVTAKPPGPFMLTLSKSPPAMLPMAYTDDMGDHQIAAVPFVLESASSVSTTTQ